jgi:hypothetical protein
MSNDKLKQKNYFLLILLGVLIIILYYVTIIKLTAHA